MLSKFWSEVTRLTEPYVPGEQPKVKNMIKLNTNENPYPPSPKVLAALKGAVDGNLRLYPDPTADELCEAIAKAYDVAKSQVFIGNGSDEVLAFSFLAFFNQDEQILFPDITYSFYPVYANLYRLDYKEVPLNEDFTIPVEQFFHAEGGVIFPNPNAPTSIGLGLEQIEKILQNNPDKVVIVDEAYIDFGGESAVPLIRRYDNLLVIQTLSKSRSLAGLRVGFAFGNEQLIEGLNRIKNSFNSYTLDRLALVGAKAAIEDTAYFEETRSKIMETRHRVIGELRQLNFTVLDSQANFLFMKHARVDAKQIFETLKEKGIYVRYFNKSRIDQFLRVTIGTDEEMNRLMEELKNIL
ncbi:histidinol-phosphate transaminase [Caldifermentibacillus hisashii]|uniref:histidinol-phosphate transaminase n=1 Tax=Caldifermentibacillus hisashii TaxID=996558 RepID=UPI0034D743DA